MEKLIKLATTAKTIAKQKNIGRPNNPSKISKKSINKEGFGDNLFRIGNIMFILMNRQILY